MLRQLIGFLTLMFYELITRMLFVYNDSLKRKKTRAFMTNLHRDTSLVSAESAVIGVIGLNIILYLRILIGDWYRNLDLFYQFVPAIIASFIIVHFSIGSNSFFSKTFIELFKKKSLEYRVFRYLLASFVFIFIPSVFLYFEMQYS